jgi:hypothetical protein
VEGRRRMGAYEPTQAAIEDVRSPVPGGAQSTRDRAGFKNLGPVAVHLQVRSARETSHAPTNDEDLRGSGRAGDALRQGAFEAFAFDLEFSIFDFFGAHAGGA